MTPSGSENRQRKLGFRLCDAPRRNRARPCPPAKFRPRRKPRSSISYAARTERGLHAPLRSNGLFPPTRQDLLLMQALLQQLHLQLHVESVPMLAILSNLVRRANTLARELISFIH